jgi:hypothetical protein
VTGPRPLRARPACAVCGAPVESFTEEDGAGALAGFVLFVARCHGAVERQKVRRSLTKGLNFGAAFVPKNRLGASEPPRALPPLETATGGPCPSP